MAMLLLLSFRSSDDFGFHFLGIPLQSFFISLKQLAQLQGRLRIHVIASQA
jgi:hypothetical protein